MSFIIDIYGKTVNHDMLEILIFLVLGIIFGIILGVIPGLHPNNIIIALPILLSIQIPIMPMLAFLVAMAVANNLSSFIPSILLGAPDAGSELAVLPGHKMLLDGHGYDAIKLAVIGSIGAVILVIVLVPILIISIPAFYSLIKSYIYIFLIAMSMLIIISQKQKVLTLLCFLLSGIIGLLSSVLPINSIMILFPILSGFFGVSMLLLQVINKTKIPDQNLDSNPKKEEKRFIKPIVTGTVGGIFSGFLPGVGTSQVAAAASIEKNPKSFLVTLGAISSANILLSILSLWLISNPRSGVAVVIEQIAEIGFVEFLFIGAVALSAVGISAMLTLWLARFLLKNLKYLDYSKLGIAVIGLLTIMVYITTGIYGLFLLSICTSLGLFTNIAKINRGCLMGVLIIPTILFYLL